MILKNICGIIVIFISIASCVVPPQNYVIQGYISDVKEGFVYLKRYNFKGFTDTDSAIITNGSFEFRGVFTEALAYGVTTKKENKSPLVFFLNNESISMKINESEMTIEVKGSNINDLYFQNAPLVRQEKYNIDSLVANHPASVVSAYFLSKDFAWRMNVKELKEIRTKLDRSLDGSSYVNRIDTLIKQLERVQVGAIAPDFTLPDVDGNPLSLSSLRGKYVLIDFWASWCPDCRRENLNLTKVYNKYKDQSFTILGVSLDRQKEAWLSVIDKDSLIWKHVWDINAWQSDIVSTYGIVWIPTSYLIDPNGVIVAVGLRYQNLIDKLSEVL